MNKIGQFRDNPWNFNEQDSNLFEDLLKYGWWVIHGSGNKHKICSCVNDNGEADQFCTLCWGTGSEVTFKKQLVRRKVYSSQDEATPIGVTPATLANMIYMKASAKPQENDIILEVSWNVTEENIFLYGKPIAVNRVYRIGQVEPLRMGNGFIYFMASIEVKSSNKDWINKLVLNLNTTTLI
jgi:hypothetical protein